MLCHLYHLIPKFSDKVCKKEVLTSTCCGHVTHFSGWFPFSAKSEKFSCLIFGVKLHKTNLIAIPPLRRGVFKKENWFQWSSRLRKNCFISGERFGRDPGEAVCRGNSATQHNTPFVYIGHNYQPDMRLFVINTPNSPVGFICCFYCLSLMQKHCRIVSGKSGEV